MKWRTRLPRRWTSAAATRSLGHPLRIPIKFGRFLRFLGQREKSRIEVNVVKSLVPKLEAGRLYFLPSFYAE